AAWCATAWSTTAPPIPRTRDAGSGRALAQGVGLDRLFAVVGLRLVAAGRATAAGRGLDEAQRQLPLAERHALGDQAGIAAAVHGVAQHAAAAFLRIVDVQEMEVSLPVAEAGG